MDRAKNGLALVRKLPREPEDVPRAPTIQPRRRYVQEHQQFGLGSELNTDREMFASFGIQGEHEGIGEELKLQEVDNFFDIGVFLLLRDVIRLLQVSGESHGLAYAHPFSVGGSTSEVTSERLSINGEITGNDTDTLPLSEDVHLLWTSPNVRETFGNEFVDQILRYASYAVLYGKGCGILQGSLRCQTSRAIDTRKHGKPDLVKLALKMVREFNAEAARVISNQTLTEDLVYGLNIHGIPAYGAIFDS